MAAGAAAAWWLGEMLGTLLGLESLWPLGPVGAVFLALTAAELLLERHAPG